MSFSHNMWLPISSVMEVFRGNLDVRVKSVLIAQDSTASIMGHIEMICQELVLKVNSCLLQCDDVPFPRNVLLDGTFFSTSRSWIPVVDAESFLHRRTIRHVVVETVFRIG